MSISRHHAEWLSLVGLDIDGVSRNIGAFRPEKNWVNMEFNLPHQGEEMKAKVEEARTMLTSETSESSSTR
jgi:hypothetical protein